MLVLLGFEEESHRDNWVVNGRTKRETFFSIKRNLGPKGQMQIKQRRFVVFNAEIISLLHQQRADHDRFERK